MHKSKDQLLKYFFVDVLKILTKVYVIVFGDILHDLEMDLMYDFKKNRSTITMTIHCVQHIFALKMEKSIICINKISHIRALYMFMFLQNSIKDSYELLFSLLTFQQICSDLYCYGNRQSSLAYYKVDGVYFVNSLNN